MIWRNRFLQCIHWFVFILITNPFGYALAAPEKPNTQNSQHASSDSTIHNLGASVTHFYQWQSLQTLGNHTTLHADKWQGKGISLGQILASETGIRVLNTGGAGAFQTLSIRGIPGSHVLIYKDGVLLNNSRNDAVNLSSINMNEIQSIHIYKGHAPAHLGGNSAGGVIHLQSYSPVHSTKSQTKLFTQYGSHNTSDMTIALLGSLSASTRWQSTIGMQHSDNDFKYFNNNGTPYNPDDDKYTKRTNSQYTRWSGLHAFDALLASGSLHFQLSHKHQQGGYPGTGNTTTQTAGFKNTTLNALSRWQHSPLWNNHLLWDVQAQYKTDHSYFHWYYPKDYIGSASKSPQSVGHLIHGSSIQNGFTLDIPYTQIKNHSEGRFEWLSPRQYEGVAYDEQWQLNHYRAQNTSSIVLQLPLGFRQEVLWQNALVYEKCVGGCIPEAVRFNDTTIAPTQTNHYQSYRIHLAHHAWQNQVKSWVSYGTYYQDPGVHQRFGSSRTTIPNPELQAETGKNAEIGIQIQHSNSKVSLTAYESLSKNGIFELHSLHQKKPVNIHSAHIQGIEMSLLTPLLPQVLPRLWSGQLLWNYTVQSTKNASDIMHYQGNKLPNEPSHELSQSVSYDWNDVFTMEYELQYHTTLYQDLANTIAIPSQILHHAMVSYAVKKYHSKISLSLRNISDKMYQNPYLEYPTPGRQWFMNWGIQF